jgi:hypothetical protein
VLPLHAASTTSVLAAMAEKKSFFMRFSFYFM